LFYQSAFFVLASLGYFGLCYLIWRPLPLALTGVAHWASLALGALLYFCGLAFILWGRLTLGKLYFVSDSQGAQLFEGHRLVAHDPFAYVRHPMYLGVVLIGLGGILLYRTWAFVFIALNFFGLVQRTRREETALQAEFGEQWLDYCRRVPRWLPKRISNTAGKTDNNASGIIFSNSIWSYIKFPLIKGLSVEPEDHHACENQHLAFVKRPGTGLAERCLGGHCRTSRQKRLFWWRPDGGQLPGTSQRKRRTFQWNRLLQIRNPRPIRAKHFLVERWQFQRRRRAHQRGCPAG
jgi:protein-S-isoprenylcysteine O-methyltransferase Ste14